MRELKPERALILYDESGGPEMEVAAAHGIDPKTVWVSAPLSTSLLDKVRLSGVPLLTNDARRDPDFTDSFSLQVSEIRSVLCVPLFGPNDAVVGLLYADSTVASGAFRRQHLAGVTAFARQLERLLFSSESGRPRWPHPQTPTSAAPTRANRSSRPVPVDTSPTPTSPPPPTDADLRLPLASKVWLFRSLATMVASGISLARGLHLLAAQDEQQQLATLAHGIVTRLERGQALSASMRQFPRSFAAFECNLVEVAERSGKLHLVVERLASRIEGSHRTRLKVRSALTYPALLLGACLLLLLVVPPFLLDGQLRVLAQSGLEPPLLTRAMIGLSGLVRSPWFALASAVMVVALATLVAQLGRRPAWRLAGMRAGLSIPYVGPVLRLMGVAEFSHALALQLEAGVLLSQALPMAGQASDNPVLAEQVPHGVAALLEGANLTQALSQCSFFPTTYLSLLEVSETSGHTVKTLDWLARFYEEDIETGLARFAAVFEPLMLLSMGLMVAVTLLATLLPTLRLVETL